MRISLTPQLRQFIQSLGISLEEIAQSTALPHLLWQENLQLTDTEYFRLLSVLDERMTDEQLLAFSQIEQLQLFVPPLFAAMCAANGLAGLKRLAKYKALIGPIHLQLKETPKRVILTFQFDCPKDQLPRLAVINEQLLMISLLRTATGKEIKPVAISSGFDYGIFLEKYLGVRATLRKENQISFSRSDLSIPFLTENNVMWQYLKPQFSKELVTLSAEKNFTETVQRALLQAVPSGSFTLMEVACSLGVSARTLQRNLSAEGTTFNRQLQLVQEQLSYQYLENPSITTTEITYLLGYSDNRSFIRAFKNWTGQTLTEYRQSLLESKK